MIVSQIISIMVGKKCRQILFCRFSHLEEQPPPLIKKISQYFLLQVRKFDHGKISPKRAEMMFVY